MIIFVTLSVILDISKNLKEKAGPLIETLRSIAPSASGARWGNFLNLISRDLTAFDLHFDNHYSSYTGTSRHWRQSQSWPTKHFLLLRNTSSCKPAKTTFSTSVGATKWKSRQLKRRSLRRALQECSWSSWNSKKESRRRMLSDNCDRTEIYISKFNCVISERANTRSAFLSQYGVQRRKRWSGVSWGIGCQLTLEHSWWSYLINGLQDRGFGGFLSWVFWSVGDVHSKKNLVLFSYFSSSDRFLSLLVDYGAFWEACTFPGIFSPPSLRS